MSLAAQVIVLAEDVRHRKLIRKYLRKRGYSPHRIREVEWFPKYGTPCIKFVLEQVAVEVAGIRAKHSTYTLVVVADADEKEVEERIQELESRILSSGQSARQESEPIAFIVPKRNIETWLFYLEGNVVDEGTDYKPQCRSLDNGDCATKFAAFTVPRRASPAGCPSSLEYACQVELPRIPS